VRATKAGVTFVRGSDFFPREGGESSARLAFSYEAPERIVEGVRILAGQL
jgi:DNA-binding transcriptional MocR family regulator